MVLFFFCAAGCGPGEKVQEIDLSKREAVAPAAPETGGALRIAVGGMITPREGFIYYREFLNYIGEKINKPVKLVDREGYEGINNLLETGGLEAAFVCSGPYVDGKKKFGLELLAAPQAYGKTTYNSYIIVPADSTLKSFEELKGKTFAFTDPKSNTGKLVPTYMLAKMNETPDSFFGKYYYTYAHDRSIEAVGQKLADGAAVDSLIWEYLSRTRPELTSKAKIISRSPPYGIPPFVVRRDISSELKAKIKNAVLNAHLDPKGAEILKKMMIDKFVEGEDKAYDSVREMEAWIEAQKK
jgi:phosphonate transport system substrate-binding protein